MLVLDTARKLSCVLSGAITTNQLEYVSSYADASSSAFTEGINVGATNNTTAVDIVASPASGQRLVKTVWICNKDTVAATVTVYIDQSGTTRRICKITLQPDESLEIGVAGIRVITTNKTGYIKFAEVIGNVNAGTLTLNTWNIRTINTEVHDSANLGSLSSNQMTLASGTYIVSASAPAVGCGRHQLKLYNVTDAADVILGTGSYTDPATSQMNRSYVTGQFTITAQKAFELRHNCASTRASDGMGTGNTFGNSTMCQAEFWKVA